MEEKENIVAEEAKKEDNYPELPPEFAHVDTSSPFEDFKEEPVQEEVIKPAGSARTVAAFLDFIIMVILTFLTSTLLGKTAFTKYAEKKGYFVLDDYNALVETLEYEESINPLFSKNPDYDEKNNSNVTKYLLITDNSVKAKYDNYGAFDDAIYSFYTNYLTKLPESKGAFFNTQELIDANLAANKYTTYWYNVFVLGCDDVDHIYTADELQTRADYLKDSDLFVWQEDHAKRATPKDDLYNEGELTDDAKTALLALFTGNSNTISKQYELIDSTGKTNKISLSVNNDAFDFALNHWIYEAGTVDNKAPIFNKLMDLQIMSANYNKYCSTIPFAISLPLIGVILYFVLPLIIKKGRTLGKLALNVEVVNYKEKSPIKVLTLAIRSIPTIALFTGVYLLCSLLNSLIFYFVAVIILFVGYIIFNFSRTKQAVHDKIAKTCVINGKKRGKKASLNAGLK